MAQDAIALTEAGETWFQTGLMREAKGSSQRGTEADVATVVALKADLDILNPKAHKGTNLPATEDEAQSILAACPLPASMIVHSGNGLQAYWLLDVPFIITTEADRARIKAANVRLLDCLRAFASRKGWAVDGVANLEHLMRLPGTYNHKLGPKAGRVLLREDAGHRYTIEQLEAVPPAPLTVSGEIDFDAITIDLPAQSPAARAAPEDAPQAAREAVGGWQLIDSDDEVLARMKLAKNADAVQALWAGELRTYPSRSEAVLALLRNLAFYTRDPHQIRRIASQSPACKAYEKWHRTADDSIAKAIAHAIHHSTDPEDQLARVPAVPLDEVDVADDADHYRAQTITISATQLPRYVREVADYLATARECRVGLGEIVAALFTLQAVTGKRLRVVNRSRNYYANLWAVVLADSGTDKSGLAELVQGLLDGELAPLAPALDVCANSTMEGFLRYHGGLVPPDKNADHLALRAKERELVARHKAELEGSALLVDEVRAFFGQMVPEVSQRVNVPLLCQLVDNGNITTRTKGEGVAVLGDACISLLGMATPDRYNAEMRNPHFVEAGVSFRIVPVNCEQTHLAGYSQQQATREQAVEAITAVRNFATTAGTHGQRIGVTYGTGGDPLGEAVDAFAETPLAVHFRQVRPEDWNRRFRSKLLIQSAKMAATMALAARAEQPVDSFNLPEVETVDASPYLSLCVRRLGTVHIANSFHEVMLTEQADRMENVLNIVRRAGKDCAPMWRIRERAEMEGRVVDDALMLLVAKGEVDKVQTPAGKSCVYCARGKGRGKR